LVHPATLIFMWCVSVMLFAALPFAALFVCGVSMIVLAIYFSPVRLAQLFRRTRWIMFSLLLVYAYTTAGQPVIPALGLWSPTQEGLVDGALQLSRLLAALSGLAILLHRLSRNELIAGLYQMLIPLQWFGLARERLAVRLALTLQDSEAALLRERKAGLSDLGEMFLRAQQGGGEVMATRQIEIVLPDFKRLDGLCLLLAFTLLLWVWQQ
jgi:energy-coupling factor transport system permease protein